MLTPNIKSSDEILTVGTNVSARWKGSFSEAKIIKVDRNVECEITITCNPGLTYKVPEKLLTKSPITPGIYTNLTERNEINNNNQMHPVFVKSITDKSMYTIEFNDGVRMAVKRSSLCLTSETRFCPLPTPIVDLKQLFQLVDGNNNQYQRQNDKAESILASKYDKDNSLLVKSTKKQPKLTILNPVKAKLRNNSNKYYEQLVSDHNYEKNRCKELCADKEDGKYQRRFPERSAVSTVVKADVKPVTDAVMVVKKRGDSAILTKDNESSTEPATDTDLKSDQPDDSLSSTTEDKECSDERTTDTDWVLDQQDDSTTSTEDREFFNEQQNDNSEPINLQLGEQTMIKNLQNLIPSNSNVISDHLAMSNLQLQQTFDNNSNSSNPPIVVTLKKRIPKNNEHSIPNENPSTSLQSSEQLINQEYSRKKSKRSRQQFLNDEGVITNDIDYHLPFKKRARPRAEIFSEAKIRYKAEKEDETKES